MKNLLSLIALALVATACGTEESRHATKSAGGSGDATLALALAETGAALADVDAALTDYSVSVLVCDKDEGAPSAVYAKTFTKAEIEGKTARIPMTLTGVRVFPKSLTVSTAGTTAVLTPAAHEKGECGRWEGFKTGKAQRYADAAKPGVWGELKLTNNVGASEVQSGNVAVAFDVALGIDSAFGQVDSNVAVATSGVAMTLDGAAPPAFGLAKSDLADASPQTSNVCRFTATFHCLATPVLANGKLTSCDGTPLAQTAFKVYDTAATPVKVIAQSAGTLAGGTTSGNAQKMTFEFPCKRGDLKVPSEAKPLRLQLEHKGSTRTFDFTLNLKYAL